MVLDTVDSGFVVKQNIRQQILWKRKLFQRKGSKVKGAGLPFRGMPPVPPPGSCRLLNIPELSQLASPAGDHVAFLITVIKCPREDLKMKIYFSSRLQRAQV